MPNDLLEPRYAARALNLSETALYAELLAKRITVYRDYKDRLTVSLDEVRARSRCLRKRQRRL